MTDDAHRHGMRTLQTTHLPCDITASHALSWSQDDQLAVATNRGVVVLDLVPNPRCSAPNLYFEQTMLAHDLCANPHLEESYAEGLELLEKLPPSEHHRVVRLFYNRPAAEEPNQVDVVSWSPIGAMSKRASSLTTLTGDGWLRVYQQKGEEWIELFDVSKMLLERLKKNSWNDCAPPNSASDDKLGKHLNDLENRRLHITITGLLWIPVVSNPILVAISKAGQLSFWKVGGCNSLSFQSFFPVDVGEVRHLSCHPLDENHFLIFLGAIDGRLKILEISVFSCEVKDLGYVWSAKDMAKVTRIAVVREDRIQHRITLCLAKEKHLVLCEVSLGKSAAIVKKKVVSRAAGSPRVIDILPQSAAGVHLLVCEKGKPKRLTVDSDLKIELFEDEPTELDVTNFKVVGAQRSHGGAIYAFAQNISAYHDHLVFRTPGRVVFQTAFDAEQLSGSLLGSGEPSISLLKDSLEVYRTLCMMDDCVSKLPPLTDCSPGKRKLFIWMYQMFLNLEQENRDELEKVLERLCIAELCSHAAKVLRENEERNDDFSALAKFLLRFESNPEVRRVAAAAAAKNLRPENDWRCILCGKGSAVASEGSAVSVECESGHAWPLCNRSLQICDSPNPLRCRWCESLAIAATEDDDDDNRCTLCDGPLVFV